VSVEAGEEGAGWVYVAVSDTGVGIAPEDLPRVFDRFYRTDESRTRDSGGFGLGLSIARELVDAMGGTIGVSSQVGLGTTFRVRLPRHAAGGE
jgi:two-component system sensor histidine kinase BaeS